MRFFPAAGYASLRLLALAGLAGAAPAPRAATPNPVAWFVDSFTTHNARRGDAFEAVVRGLLDSGGNSDIKFELASPGPCAEPASHHSLSLASPGACPDSNSWATVTPAGVVSGTPGYGSARRTTLTVRASSAAANSSALLDIIIPVRKAGEPLVENLTVMSYNLWYGGTRVNNYHPKQVSYLAKSGADIIGVQESAYNGQHATRLASALGWYSWQGSDVGFISKYPIVASSDDGGYIAQARIALDGDRSHVSVWNAHLHSDPYGPYDFCFDHMSVDEVLAREESSQRGPQMSNILSDMASDLAAADDTPVILLGDMNAPSHLDWTEALKDKNCGYANVSWPTSVRPIEAGLTDTFRLVHPDPVAKPGITWSPIDITNSNGQPEPLDRIDFIYHKGTMAVVHSETQVVGHPKASPDYKDNRWTSDHASVVTNFRLKERPAPLVLTLVSSRVQLGKETSDECNDI